MMVLLRNMVQAEYLSYRRQMIEENSIAMLENGSATENDAISKAEKEQDEILPNGVETKDHYLYVIENEEKRNCGYMWFGRIQREYGETAFVFDLNIKKEHRLKNYGSEAMKSIEEKIKGIGLNAIELYVLSSNVAARKLYEKMGYKRIRGNEKGEVLKKEI